MYNQDDNFNISNVNNTEDYDIQRNSYIVMFYVRII